MSTAIVQGDQSAKLRAIRKLTKPLASLADKSQLIRAVVPNLPGASSLISTFQRQPKNIVRIVVSDEDRQLSPGTTLYGKVRIILSEPVPVRSLTVTLYGESVACAPRTSPQGNRILFSSCFKLVEEMVTIDIEQKILAPKLYEFPFEVVLPRTVTILEDDWPFDEETMRFNDNLTQPMPGSFESYSPIEGRTFNCKIHYHAVAKLISKKEDQADVIHNFPLTVIAKDDRALTAGDALNVSMMRCSFKFKLTNSAASSRLAAIETPSKEQAELQSDDRPPPTSRQSFRNKMKDKIFRFTLPVYSFDLDAEIPGYGRLSMPLDIILKLRWNLSSEKSINATHPVLLQSMRVELRARTMFRGSMGRTYAPDEDNLFCLLQATDSYHSLWKSDPILISELKDPVSSLGTETRTAELMFVHPHSLLPAFKTWNIAREYFLTVLCDLQCAGESFQAKYEVDKFDILAEGNVQDDFLEKIAPARQATVESDNEDDNADIDEHKVDRGQAEEILSESKVLQSEPPVLQSRPRRRQGRKTKMDALGQVFTLSTM